MQRTLLPTLALLLLAAAAFIAWDQPQPDPDTFHGNPCDGSILAAFYDVGDGHEAEPYLRECRGPARRQLAASAALIGGAIAVLLVRRHLPASSEPVP